MRVRRPTAGWQAEVMMSEHGRGQEAPQPGKSRWRQMLGEWPAMRQVFHALCVMSNDEDPTDLLEFAARQQWMADLARRFETVVARFDGTTAIEREDGGLLDTLWQLYAATRVRDALLLAHQPDPADDSVCEFDQALGRKQPAFRPVPVD
jgi:hypothetical protein